MTGIVYIVEAAMIGPHCAPPRRERRQPRRDVRACGRRRPGRRRLRPGLELAAVDQARAELLASVSS